MADMNTIYFILAAIVAAEFWNNYGYIQELINAAQQGTTATFDKKAMKHDLLIGLILGIALVVYQAMTVNTPIGFAIPQYTSLHDFIISAGSLMPFVIGVDKLLVGGAFNINSRTVTTSTPTPTPSQSTASKSNQTTIELPAPPANQSDLTIDN